MEKFNIHKFIIGICKLLFSKYSAIWIAATFLIHRALHNGFSDQIKMTILIIWGVISICFFFSEAITKMISERGNLNIDLKAGVSR